MGKFRNRDNKVVTTYRNTKPFDRHNLDILYISFSN
jgi:hypothetical protein